MAVTNKARQAQARKRITAARERRAKEQGIDQRWLTPRGNVRHVTIRQPKAKSFWLYHKPGQ